jgi:hypothetical protein
MGLAFCMLVVGCASTSHCPALSQEVLTPKEIKANKKSAGKQRGLFSNSTNKSSGYKNGRAYKAKKKKQHKK